jgi:hypothetical protein
MCMSRISFTNSKVRSNEQIYKRRGSLSIVVQNIVVQNTIPIIVWMPKQRIKIFF